MNPLPFGIPNPSPARGEGLDPLASPDVLTQADALLPSPLAGEGPGERGLQPQPPANTPTGESLPHRLATLELDLQARDEELAQVRAEYERLRQEADQARESAADAGFAALAKKLAAPFSQLATMRALVAEGREVRLEDVLKLFGRVEAILAGAGLQPIGVTGERAIFDTRLHQRMSGADVDDGDPVRVRFIGYRLNDTILQKAMISRVGEANEELEQ